MDGSDCLERGLYFLCNLAIHGGRVLDCPGYRHRPVPVYRHCYAGPGSKVNYHKWRPASMRQGKETKQCARCRMLKIAGFYPGSTVKFYNYHLADGTLISNDNGQYCPLEK